jgi:hypothetical protein
MEIIFDLLTVALLGSVGVAMMVGVIVGVLLVCDGD